MAPASPYSAAVASRNPIPDLLLPRVGTGQEVRWKTVYSWNERKPTSRSWCPTGVGQPRPRTRVTPPGKGETACACNGNYGLRPWNRGASNPGPKPRGLRCLPRRPNPGRWGNLRVRCRRWRNRNPSRACVQACIRNPPRVLICSGVSGLPPPEDSGNALAANIASEGDLSTLGKSFLVAPGNAAFNGKVCLTRRRGPLVRHGPEAIMVGPSCD